MRALDRTIAEFQGDPSRLYLTGLSMGGSGTLRIAAYYPGRFAALAPICPDFDGEFVDTLARGSVYRVPPCRAQRLGSRVRRSRPDGLVPRTPAVWHSRCNS